MFEMSYLHHALCRVQLFFTRENDAGASLVEYAFLVAFGAIVCFGAIFLLYEEIIEMFTRLGMWFSYVRSLLPDV